MIRILLLLALCLGAAPALAQASADDAEALKQSALNLNRDLLILEEELLYPPNSQVAVYLSMDVAEYFALDAVKLKIDDTFVAAELYTEKQVDALIREADVNEDNQINYEEFLNNMTAKCRK